LGAGTGFSMYRSGLVSIGPGWVTTHARIISGLPTVIPCPYRRASCAAALALAALALAALALAALALAALALAVRGARGLGAGPAPRCSAR